MGDASFAVFIILLIVTFLALTICHYCDLIPWLKAWVISNREEKIGLTLLRGHYHPNGYLVHSDSTDIHLGTSGSFKRFDSVDRDFRIATAATSPYCDVSGTGVSEWNHYHNHTHAHNQVNNNAQQTPQTLQHGRYEQKGAPPQRTNSANELSSYEIPPQPLRPAPTVPPQSPPLVRDGTRGERVGITRRGESEEGRSTTMGIVDQIPQSATTPTIASTTGEFGTTSIRPIPRPVSSVNMVALQQHAAIATGYPFINPLPPPPTPTANQQVVSAVIGSSSDEPDPLANISLKRALSCESVCSDTSVALENLEASNITGYLCIALEYDSDNQEMVANVLEAKDLRPPATISNPDTPMDTYIRIFLLPDKTTNIQTKVIKESNSPSYKERVLFNIMHPREQSQCSLSFHIYSVDQLSHSLIGEGELRLGDVSLRQPVTTWITLTDTGQRGTEFGEVMFSLSYLPTAERLTVVVVKARNLNYSNEKETGDAFVKVYLLQNGKKMHKKKTSTKKSERCPIFNEAMMFSVPAHNLQTIQLRLTVAEPSNVENVKAYAIGHVIVGAQATGRSLNHWNQMLTALRKPVAMWHSLRK